MKTPIPRFLLGNPKGWKTFATTADSVVLPGFSSYAAAASYCQADRDGIWELQALSCDRLRERLEAARPESLKLVAIDPVRADELSLSAVTLETVCDALRNGAVSIDPAYRLMRDHWESPWNHMRLAATDLQIAGSENWFVACLHPQNMKFTRGQPLWFWLDWFDGRHILTELQTERGGTTEREFFRFHARCTADGFYKATVARLLGCISNCEIDSQSGSQFEVTMWEKDRAVCNRKLATLGKR